MKSNTYRKRRAGLPINRKQISIIKMAQGLLGISDPDYRRMLKTRFNVTSCTKLSYDQAGEFIRELESKGFTLKPKKNSASRPAAKRPARQQRPAIPRDQGNVVALANREEIDKINSVAALIEWREANGLDLFLEKRMGIRDGRVRTSKDAYLAIEGLKKMFENQMKARHGKDWWVGRFESAAVMNYIALHKPVEWR